MKDDAIRRRSAERDALIGSGVRAFCLPNLRGEEQARRFVDNRKRILKQATPGALRRTIRAAGLS